MWTSNPDAAPSPRSRVRVALVIASAAALAAAAPALRPGAQSAAGGRAEPAPAAPGAIARMQAPGAEARALARRAGTWDVVMTLRPRADAAPVTTAGLLAERAMVGLFLQEIMRPAPVPRLDRAGVREHAPPDFRRIAYLTYNRVEGRWQYVSLDTRFPAGIMPAWSAVGGAPVGGPAGDAGGGGRPAAPDTIVLEFEPLGFPGFGAEVEGRLTRSNFVITRDGDDRETARQYWTQADGTGRTWLAVQYDYTRRR